jgi:xylulokinase
MAQEHLFLATDLGTSAVKVGAFNSEGSLAARAAACYETRSPRSRWAEQDPEAWWCATRQAIRDVAAQLDSSRVRGISVAALTPSLVCVNADGKSVCPAPIWSDWRAEAEWTELTRKLGYETRFTPLPRLLWMRHH